MTKAAATEATETSPSVPSAQDAAAPTEELTAVAAPAGEQEPGGTPSTPSIRVPSAPAKTFRPDFKQERAPKKRR